MSTTVDKRAAARYLDALFGKAEGHVSVAYKDKGESWQEAQFSWPIDRTKILGWAAVHHDANIFICPALREDNSTRRKGDGKALRWLWADVDMDKVPEDRKDDVRARIKELGTLVVASGSGENRHVYVRLAREVPVAEHLRLNTGLRDYLYADNKQSDNSLLRLPGTTNWKTEQGSPVKPVGGVVRAKDVSPEHLLSKTVFKRVKVTVGAEVSVVDWTEKQPAGLSRRVLRMTEMTPEEGKTRYGSRHGAVWAIAGELHKRGLDADEVHTLMDLFPPGVDKQEEENGYDLHKDVEKRLIWDRANVPSLGDDDMDALEDAVMEMEAATDEDFQSEVESEIDRLAEEYRKRSRASQRAKELEAERTWVSPPNDVSWSLTDGLSNPPRPIPYLIQGLAGAKHNVVIAAQFKTGKTQFVMGTIAAALCDGTPFLDCEDFEVHVPHGGVMVGHWNCEMDPAEMMDDYIRKVGIQNTDNLHVANLRGYQVNIMSPVGKQWAIDWLKDRDVKVWTIDSFARLARMAMINENDNNEVMDLLMCIDQIKLEAGVDACFLIAHTGRAKHEEGEERARAATAIDDWPDARWIMTNVNHTRLLRVEGRGVKLEETAMVYDHATGRCTKGHGGRVEVAEDAAGQMVTALVKDHPGITQTELYQLMKLRKVSQRAAVQYIEDAVDGLFIEVRLDSSGRGKPAKRHYLVGTRVEGDDPPQVDRNKRATPGVVNMRSTRPTTRRRNRAPDVGA